MRSLAILAACLVALGACGSRAGSAGPSESAHASPSPSAATASPSQPPPTPSATVTPRPNPTAGPGTYTSLAYGYRVDLPAGWRRSACQSTRLPAEAPGVETFTNATVDAETGTDTGPASDVVLVRVEPNPTGMTALAWLEAGHMGSSAGTRYEQITFDGNPDAARIVTADGTALAYAVNARFRIYATSRGLRDPSPASAASARGIMTSLHILRDAELAEARATLATPSPVPARSAEETADALARGFTQQDTAVLARVAQECLTFALENAGAAFYATTKVMRDLAADFGRGLSVTVQARPVEYASAPGTGANVRATWTDPGQAPREVKLMLQKVGDTWYWIGVLRLRP